MRNAAQRASHLPQVPEPGKELELHVRVLANQRVESPNRASPICSMHLFPTCPEYDSYISIYPVNLVISVVSVGSKGGLGDLQVKEGMGGSSKTMLGAPEQSG